MGYTDRRKGETLPNADKKSRIERQSFLKQNYGLKRLTLFWQRAAITVIKEKIKHYKKTGNTNKLAIYKLKLKHQSNLIEKLGGLISK